MTWLGLAALWHGRRRFVVLDTAFGNGCRFLDAWHHWLDDPCRCDRLWFIAMAAEPPSRQALAAEPRSASVGPLVRRLVAAWPPLTPDLHTLRFEQGRVQLQLVIGSASKWLSRIEAQVDAFLLHDFGMADGVDAPPEADRPDPRRFKRLARLAAPQAVLFGPSDSLLTDEALRRDLRSAGFEPIDSPRDRTSADNGGRLGDVLAAARFAPRFVPRRGPPRPAVAANETLPSHAIVVGAGLAGCAVAWALAEQGVPSTVLERRTTIADAASGNAAGIFHGVVHRDDATHARFNRAAALDAHIQVVVALARHGVAGSVAGMLRVETAPAARVDDMAATLAGLRLPTTYVRAVSAQEANSLAGVALDRPAWHYPGGGWVDPRGLARAYLERTAALLPASAPDLRVGMTVDAIRQSGDAWDVLDDRGEVIVSSSVLVLANADDALRLLGDPDWPIAPSRGQVSACDASRLPSTLLPRLPITGSGYVLPPIDGSMWFGATATRDDDAGLRVADHRTNIARLGVLLPGLPDLDERLLGGRIGFRASSRDRLPAVGPIPQSGAAGLHVCIALGSRGIAWSGLCAQVVAAQICGAPAPLPADLLRAIDPARFASRDPRSPGRDAMLVR